MEQEFGADPAFVPAASRPQAVVTKGFNPGENKVSRDPSRVLFLDIDGVVLSGEELQRTRNRRYLPPSKIALVQEICDRTGATVVVSSTWRLFDETADLLRHAGLTLHPDWRTPRGRQHGSLIVATTRGSEIARWLARNPLVTDYAIVDDDSDMLPEQMERFVKTPFHTGIERAHVERLVAAIVAGARSAETAENRRDAIHADRNRACPRSGGHERHPSCRARAPSCGPNHCPAFRNT